MDPKLFKSVPVKSSEITSEHLYLKRRDFIRLAGTLAAGTVLAACTKGAESAPMVISHKTFPPSEETALSSLTDELGSPLTKYESVTGFNNYYEFSFSKEGISDQAADLKISPWQVEVSGLVNKPRMFDIEDLLKFTQEERIYRMRCVEGWSMVVPWTGFPLASLLKEVEPTGDARFVRFTTLNRPEEMPGLGNASFPWPYREGLRLDEALNNLAILSTGLYGKSLPNQNGAPIRLVVPWKYGFKSGKSIVKIELVAEEPVTFWPASSPGEYGFYSNVNPTKSHPRWSQQTERRIGEVGRRDTLMFNGYAEEVAPMYQGMDLNIYY